MYAAFQLTLVVTQACNLRCSYCYTGRKFRRQMSDQTARRSIDAAFASLHDGGTLELGFFGGEPLLQAAAIRRWIDYAQLTAAARQIGGCRETSRHVAVLGKGRWRSPRQVASIPASAWWAKTGPTTRIDCRSTWRAPSIFCKANRCRRTAIRRAKRVCCNRRVARTVVAATSSAPATRSGPMACCVFAINGSRVKRAARFAPGPTMPLFPFRLVPFCL